MNAVDELLRYVRENSRICPMPEHWQEVYRMLPEGAGKPAVPLIPAAEDSPALFRMLRLEEHIRYADQEGVLIEVAQYLRKLDEPAWLHLSSPAGGIRA